MTILKNAYFLGERVRWNASAGHEPEAGTGTVDSLYVDMTGRLVYRVERDKVLAGRVCAFLHESEIAGRADEPTT